jgi:hypothetical protein
LKTNQLPLRPATFATSAVPVSKSEMTSAGATASLHPADEATPPMPGELVPPAPGLLDPPLPRLPVPVPSPLPVPVVEVPLPDCPFVWLE